MIHINKGLDLKLAGAAPKQFMELPATQRYQIHLSDFRWLTPQMLVQENEKVEVGTPLFADKKENRIRIVSPIAGVVRQIVRGEKRAIQTVIIERDPAVEPVREYDLPEPKDCKEVRTMLLQYGLWPFLRQRPFSTIANPDDQPKAVFISCFDSAPLAPDYGMLLQGREAAFHKGLDILRLATDNVPLHLCMREGNQNDLFNTYEHAEKHHFSGPHPSGNIGTQIHHINPINKNETVWFANPQDIAIIGEFFLNHRLYFEKRAAVTGAGFSNTGYISAVYGADIQPFIEKAIVPGNIRIINGNVLTGLSMGDAPSIRFYTHQITAIPEGGKREFLGWLLPGFRKWSLSHTYTSWIFPKRTFDFSTSLHGGRRTFMMTDVYDKVFPFDILPLFLLKACYIKDIEQMESLGIYEVDDEDFALCELVCPSKVECQQIVRDALLELKKNS